jgi:hypothetical protein
MNTHPENMDDPTGSELVLKAYHSVKLTIAQWESAAGPAAQSAAVIQAATDRILPATPIPPNDAACRGEWNRRAEIRAQFLALVGVLEMQTLPGSLS